MKLLALCEYSGFPIKSGMTKTEMVQTKTKLKFPKGFLWGAATSAHQVEGGNVNNWSEWEHANSARLAEEAWSKWKDWQQRKTCLPAGRFPEMFKAENYISGQACDHYNHYEEDFDIAKELGHNAHRFSIEWSRVEPEEGKFNEKEIEHYRQVLQALRKRGMEPFVTLWHWTNPIWIEKIGGWENKKTIDYFLRYVKKITGGLGKEIKFWMIINEPNVYVGQSYIQKNFPPRVKSFWRANKVLKNLIQANNKAYSLMHKALGDQIEIGSTHFLIAHLPYNPNSILDKLSAKLLDYVRNFRSLSWASDHQDFIGIDYYHLERIEFCLRGGRWLFFKTHVEGDGISDMNWKIYPKGIYKFLVFLKTYNLPIYILENGLANSDDSQRTKFIRDHLYWIHKAIQEGVNVKGYFHWSLLDNFEWHLGFWPRFGLVEIDYETMERKIRKSAWEYAKICRSNKSH